MSNFTANLFYFPVFFGVYAIRISQISSVADAKGFSIGRLRLLSAIVTLSLVERRNLVHCLGKYHTIWNSQGQIPLRWVKAEKNNQLVKKCPF